MFKVANPDLSVYLELTIDGRARVQEFAPGDERAFVVGSSERASLRVNGVGIAPVQFHIEREDGGIWLIPAYGIADLSVDWIRVLGPTPLDAGSVIEFCDMRIHVTIVEADPLAPDDDRHAAHRTESQVSRASYSRNLPGEEEPTLVAMRPVCADEPVTAPIHTAPARVGQAETKTFLVIGGAAVGALVLALTIFVAIRLSERHRGTTAPGTPAMIDAKSR